MAGRNCFSVRFRHNPRLFLTNGFESFFMAWLSRLNAALGVSLLALTSTALADEATKAKIDKLISEMTIEEKVGQLTMASADSQFDWPALARGEIGSVLNYYTAYDTADVAKRSGSRLGIPLLRALDVIHGYRTIFPMPLAYAATFDPENAYKASKFAAREARDSGIELTFAPMADLARDPRWGREIEGGGEDPLLSSLNAAAQVRGFKAGGLATTVKHFAGYGAAEGGRDYDAVDISEAQFRDRYLPVYHAAIDAGADSVMTAFVSFGGVPATQNKHLLRDILRQEWGFDKVVMSDLHSIRELTYHGTVKDREEAAIRAFEAGVDIDMDDGLYMKYLPNAVRSGKIAMADLDRSVRRVLQLKVDLGLFDQKPIDPKVAESKMLLPDARQAAREVAQESFVLLQNQSSTLPIPKTVKKIAVIGALANSQPDHIGQDFANVHNLDTVTLLAGLKAHYEGKAEVTFAEGCEMRCKRIEGFADAQKTAEEADFVVLALGEPRDLNGEAGSRADLRLPGHQHELLDLIAKTGKPVALVLFNGRAMAMEDVPSKVKSLIVAWHPGTEGGTALADVLSGDVAPSGKLPVTFPITTGQVPITYDHLPTGRPAMAEDRYTSKYVDTPIGPAFPFGFGLSYTTFKYGNPVIAKDRLTPDDKLTVSVPVTNSGDVEGKEVVQLYTHQQVAERSRPVRELKAFTKVSLKPGETKTVELTVSAFDLGYWDEHGNKVIEAGTFDYWIGGDSTTEAGGTFVITDGKRLEARR